MRRHLAQPGDAGVLEWDGGVEALGHGAGDEGAALLAQQGDQALGPGDQGVDARGLPVEEGDDLFLGVKIR